MNGESGGEDIASENQGIQIAGNDKDEDVAKQKRLKSLRRSEQSLDDNVRKTKQQIQDYIRDPDGEDNLGKLKNVSPEHRDRVIRGRIKALQGQVRKNEGELRKVRDQIRSLE